jgi:hypothetical protein
VPEVDPRQELIALCSIHLITGLGGGFPISSSGSRTGREPRRRRGWRLGPPSRDDRGGRRAGLGNPGLNSSGVASWSR